MIGISTKARENVRVDLGDGAWIDFKPFTTLGHGAGARAAVLALNLGEDPGTANVGYTIALARWGAVAWEGVVDDDSGEPLELTPDNVEALLTQSVPAFQAVDQRYAIPALMVELEKNVSAPGQNGTSPARARGSADGTTARRARPPAKRAPSKSTGRKPKPAN